MEETRFILRDLAEKLPEKFGRKICIYNMKKNQIGGMANGAA
jgi:hypothetical protein